MRLAILADVLELEALGHVEVELRRIQLPRSTQRVLDVDVDLRPVEGAFAFLDLVRQSVGLQRRAQVRLGSIPDRRVADGLFGPRAQIEARLEPEDVVDRPLELEHAADLGLDLIWSTEDVRVVHRQLAHAQQAVERARALVAQQPLHLGQAQRQVAIAARLEAKDERRLRAVHRLEGVVLVLDLELEHAVLVEVPVAALFPQV